MCSLKRWIVISTLFLFGTAGFFLPPAANADIYLTRTDSGTLKLTNSEPDEAEGRAYKLLLESRIPEEADVPNASRLRRIVHQASEAHEIPKSLIYSVIEVESDGETAARSPQGAQGLMQLMPETAREMGVEDPLDPRQNIFGGTKYLRYVLNRFDGDLDLALAAYNAGPGTVEEYGGIPPYEQTQQFVETVRDRFEHFKSEGDMVYTYRGKDGVLHVTNIH